MNRILVSILTVVFYVIAQFAPAILNKLHLLPSTSHQLDQMKQLIHIQLIGFIIVAIVIIVMHWYVKNPLQLELGKREPKRYIIPWIIAGLGIVFITQIIVNVITVFVLGHQQASENTLRLMKIARQMPVFFLLITIIGPLLEEFVFRRVLFGELYQLLKGSKAIRFIIASVISSAIFAVAHMDFSHFLPYFVMGIIFSGFYCYTKRLSVAIGIHMAQNGIVALIQFSLPEKLVEESLKQTQFIHHMISLL
ncbi:CPBP family intramembrane metalloprotease [Staphylococcus agnetis]|uniref:CPBP family intramembrane metalloprotease n=1 Tax=Staphylococcus agnetis TaxID=985762 RepID=A0ABD7TW48_9STAP|nr:type II CAAX endopeptidase family protein [Staphylococcus agnetis]UXU57999.1 CPBP family intramembrane metalloprotease [Staphylococcus agnetis]UXU64970.1 CPBP family intramembrane metalloprotease [Staphylococcus agnetis]UXU67311.1 CPBP family intramembrane metalloprotease [Staphylococcus agnetis]